MNQRRWGEIAAFSSDSPVHVWSVGPQDLFHFLPKDSCRKFTHILLSKFLMILAGTAFSAAFRGKNQANNSQLLFFSSEVRNTASPVSQSKTGTTWENTIKRCMLY